MENNIYYGLIAISISVSILILVRSRYALQDYNSNKSYDAEYLDQDQILEKEFENGKRYGIYEACKELASEGFLIVFILLLLLLVDNYDFEQYSMLILK